MRLIFNIGIITAIRSMIKSKEEKTYVEGSWDPIMDFNEIDTIAMIPFIIHNGLGYNDCEEFIKSLNLMPL